MTMDEETGLYSMGQGCPIHGDDHMKECSMCGAEFCRICHPRSAVCPDCADSGGEDADEEAPDFDDVRNLDELLDEDEEVDELVKEDGEAIPPEDLEDEDREKR